MAVVRRPDARPGESRLTTAIIEFRVARDDLKRTEIATRAVAVAAGEVLFAIDRFALTSNNITYATFGDAMNYWRFFPAPDGWGNVPVWGFATVVKSRVPEVAEGARFYGYWPMASHAVLTPVGVTRKGFIDGVAHRDGLAAVYNGYQNVTGDASVGDEAAYALFKPLFLTSFLLGDVLREVAAAQVVLSSASSKTALGLAWSLKAQGRPATGLTSARNADFVRATGYYAEVVTYDALRTIDRVPTVAVDFAGDRKLRRALHEHFGERLVQSIIVGDTHQGQADDGGAMPGPRPEFFFAPTHLTTRLREHGPSGFVERFAQGWDGFTGSTAAWLRVVEEAGPDAVTGHYAALAAGQVDPAEGIILRL